jgi:hypothetical protein
MKQMAEHFAGQAYYGLLDLFVAFDQCALDMQSCDMTTFQMPLGTLQLTVVPMGHTNAAQIVHGDVIFMLQDKIPAYTIPYIDDVPVRGPATCYNQENGNCKVIATNPSIRCFVFEHWATMHQILHCIETFGATVSGMKVKICAPLIEMVGHEASYKEHMPDQLRTKVIAAQ